MRVVYKTVDDKIMDNSLRAHVQASRDSIHVYVK